MKLFIVIGLIFAFYKLILKPDVIDKLMPVQDQKQDSQDDFTDYEEIDEDTD